MHLRRRRFFGGSSEKLPFISLRRHSLTREKVTQALYATKAAFSRRAEGEAQHTSVTNSATLGCPSNARPLRLWCSCVAAAALCLAVYTQHITGHPRPGLRHSEKELYHGTQIFFLTTFFRLRAAQEQMRQHASGCAAAQRFDRPTVTCPAHSACFTNHRAQVCLFVCLFVRSGSACRTTCVG
jgi:hypothetical protein